LNISVLDSGGFKADTLIVASVEDVNDHSPVFSKDVYEFRIPEGELYNIFQDPLYVMYCLLVRHSFILGSQNVDFFGYLGRYNKLAQK
jgi:hypothetical protein